MKDGDYGGEDHLSSPNGCHPDCEACSNENWTRHLGEIMEKIGEDAEDAIQHGVKAL